MKTWNAAKDIYSYYRENQLFIPELEDMSDLIGEITDILGMDEPFNSIAKLGTLVQQANEIKNGLLGKKVEIAKKTINDSLDLITKEYSEAMNKTYSKEETKESSEEETSEKENNQLKHYINQKRLYIAIYLEC